MYKSDMRTELKGTDPRYNVTMCWIQRNLAPKKSANQTHSSYGIKHLLQHDTGVYLTNGEFKDAMIKSGYDPINPNDQNWYFRLSERSRAFKKV